jgi:hypothetical protein
VLELGLQALAFLFLPFPVGDIFGNAGDTHDLPGCILNGNSPVRNPTNFSVWAEDAVLSEFATPRLHDSD